MHKMLRILFITIFAILVPMVQCSGRPYIIELLCGGDDSVVIGSIQADVQKLSLNTTGGFSKNQEMIQELRTFVEEKLNAMHTETTTDHAKFDAKVDRLSKVLQHFLQDSIDVVCIVAIGMISTVFICVALFRGRRGQACAALVFMFIAWAGYGFASRSVIIVAARIVDAVRALVGIFPDFLVAVLRWIPDSMSAMASGTMSLFVSGFLYADTMTIMISSVMYVSLVFLTHIGIFFWFSIVDGVCYVCAPLWDLTFGRYCFRQEVVTDAFVSMSPRVPESTTTPSLDSIQKPRVFLASAPLLSDFSQAIPSLESPAEITLAEEIAAQRKTDEADLQRLLSCSAILSHKNRHVVTQVKKETGCPARPPPYSSPLSGALPSVKREL